MIPRWLRLTGYLLAFASLVAALFVLVPLYRSMPALEGRITLPGLTAESAVIRDRHGVPSVSARSRREAANITGFLHAQERFFQMDLLRRMAAGELSELFGPVALPVDRRHRLHQMRVVARAALEKLPENQRELIEDYTFGVNRGLGELGEVPFEYLLLHAKPAPWRPEDSMLVICAMAFQLQDTEANVERSRTVVREVFSPAVADFLLSPADDFEAPLDGSHLESPAIPERLEFAASDAPLAENSSATPVSVPSAKAVDSVETRLFSFYGGAFSRAPGETPGSNAFAVGGGRTKSGSAIVANDMHLNLVVPNTWYRMQIAWLARDKTIHKLQGITLPGLPILVAGTNGAVAWGFTNSEIDTSDLIILETDPADPNRYRTPDGWRPFVDQTEVIAVKGGPSENLPIRTTLWGPVIGRDSRGRPLAVKWSMADPAAYNLQLAGLEDVNTARSALAFAKGAGLPPQNVIVGDQDGSIGWSIAGRIPRRVGFDGSHPVSWADGTARWVGWLDLGQYPQVFNPKSGLVWSANARMVGGAALALLGDNGYALASRALEIRNRLAAFDHRVEPVDLLALQLDDRGLYLDRWQALLLSSLDAASAENRPGRTELRALAADWGGRAVPKSAGYRLVRDFRRIVTDRVEDFLYARCRAADPAFTIWRVHNEHALFALVSKQPAGWLPAGQPGWGQLLLAAADQVIAEAGGAGALSRHTWGEYNRLAMRHPLSTAVPALHRFLDMPSVSLPGDSDVVRAQTPTFGASMRLVVQTGEEPQGILELPGGQSGHPLSAHYADGQDAWVRGEPIPLTPGQARDHLLLEPVPAE